MAAKTPVSILNEIATKKQIFLNYQLIEDPVVEAVEGPVRQPVFKYRLTVEYENKLLEEIGIGRSKKDAKHNAALAILKAMNIPLKHIHGETYAEVVPVESSVKLVELLHILVEGADTPDGDLGGNPVGELQELCMKMNLPLPTYSLDAEDGDEGSRSRLPHERIVAIVCRVGEQHEDIGRGRSKKLAKRHAAHLMAKRLRNVSSETSKIPRELTAVKRFLTLSSGDSVDGDKMEHFKIDRDLALERMPELKDPNFDVDDPIQFLAEIEDGEFKAEFIHFEEVSTRNTYQCFVKVTCEPPVNAIGEGITKDEAKLNAAKEVIEKLKYFVISCGLD